MDSKSLLAALDVSKNKLPKDCISLLEELGEIAENLDLNPADLNIDLGVIDKIYEYESVISDYNKQTILLHQIQNTLKDSFIILTSLKSLDYASNDAVESLESLIFQEKELKKQLEHYSQNLYSDEIDHKNLIKISDECELIARELVTLQAKSETFGDFPTVRSK
jgi:hypothetical protein